MGRCHPEGDSAWWLLQLAVGKALVISDILGSFQARGVLCGRRALTIEYSLMSGCGQGYKLVKDMWKSCGSSFQG